MRDGEGRSGQPPQTSTFPLPKKPMEGAGTAAAGATGWGDMPWPWGCGEMAVSPPLQPDPAPAPRISTADSPRGCRNASLSVGICPGKV